MVKPLRVALIVMALAAFLQPGAAPAANQHHAGDCMRSCCMHHHAHDPCAMSCAMNGHRMHSGAGDHCRCALSASSTTPEASVTPVIVHEAPLASMLALRTALSGPGARAARPDSDSPHAGFEPDLTDPPPRA